MGSMNWARILRSGTNGLVCRKAVVLARQALWPCAGHEFVELGVVTFRRWRSTPSRLAFVACRKAVITNTVG